MYTVSRQLYWPDGDKVVEISIGDIDSVGPDALEILEPFSDPRETVEEAWSLYEKWKQEGSNVSIDYGNTWGGSLPLLDSCEKEQLYDWAQKEYEQLAKCTWCGEVIEGDPDYIYDDWCYLGKDADPFCSCFCAQYCWEERRSK